ncbi:MAG TPA: biotin/lipoyl-containing protein [Rubricoccaceae bacterium]|nr:biotin/lipoyl-containing protein [Rubricoccaceae bacterium]
MPLQIRLGDRAFDLERTTEGLRLDGRPLDARFERLGGTADAATYLLVLDGRPHVVTLEREAGDGPGSTRVRATVQNHAVEAQVLDETAQLLERFGFEAGGGAVQREVRAPMPGLVLQVLVAPGDAVAEGQGLVVLEAMKMENELRALAAGTVAAVHVARGAAVGKNALLIEID